MRFLLLISGSLTLLAGCLLLVAAVLTIGINDGEWRNLSHTGISSASPETIWSPWQSNDGSVSIFRGFHPEQSPPVIAEYRRGRAHGWLFDFTLYEGRVAGLPTTVVPAIGPGWGTSYHWGWAAGAGLLGAALLCVGLQHQSNSPPTTA